MKSLNQSSALGVVAAGAVVLWIATILVKGTPLNDPLAMLGEISTAVSLEGLVAGAFVKWLWSYRIFRGWLVQIPDLRGIWNVTIAPVPEPGKTAESITATMTIHQTLFSIDIRVETPESTSISYAADFMTADDGTLSLAYAYRNFPRPSRRSTSPIHDGTTNFEIYAERGLKLTGEYWTSRRTVGELSAERAPAETTK